MSAFYSIDSTRVSHEEYWWGTRSPAVLLGWLLKWLRVRIPGSTDDPNVESTVSFLVETLPVQVQQRFETIAAQLAGLGFVDPIYHVIEDTGTSTTIFWATYRHSSGQHSARIHQRIWHQAKSADRGTFVVYLTAFADGSFAGSSSGKPDLATPKSVPMLRRQGANPVELWSAHVEFVAVNAPAAVRPVRSREELAEAVERHHILLRDFNLARGVFRPRSEVEQTTAANVAARLDEATTEGVQHPEILAEVERIQTQRPGWGNAIVIFVLSAIAFLAAGSGQRDWRFTLWLIPILLLHEGGHWLAMKIFGYRNLRMFFIPLFGAAVTGRNWNVPGWKKAIVSLAGPVPGIALGVALTLAGLLTHRAWLNEAAFLLIIINGFNLLPVLPLDGGHVLHAILFCRNRWLDITFRLLAIGALLLLGWNGSGRFLIYIAIVMALGLPIAFRIGKVTDTLRRTPFPPLAEGQDRIPSATADAIVTALKAALPAKTNNKTLALQTVNIFESLNARPPRMLGALGFLAVHGGAVILALLCSFLLILDKHGGGLRNFARAALRQPTHAVACNSIERWSGKDAAPQAPRNVLVATLENRSAAQRQFRALSGRLPGEASLMLIGDSLLISLPAGDDDARERWFAELQSADTNSFVILTNQSVTVSLMFVAPHGLAASNLVDELNEYLHLIHYGDLIAPWAPQAIGSSYQAHRQMRQMWHAIETNTAAAWSSAPVEAIDRQIAAAVKRGARGESQTLIKQQQETRRQEQARIYQRLRSQGFDQELIDLHTRVSTLESTNRAQRTALHRQVAAKLGLAASGSATNNVPRYGVSSGFASNRGLLVEMRWVAFLDSPNGLPALLDWLCRKRCGTIKYDFITAGLSADDLSE